MPFRFVNLPPPGCRPGSSQTDHAPRFGAPAVLRPAFLASFAVISARLRFVKCQLSKRNTFSLAISLAFFDTHGVLCPFYSARAWSRISPARFCCRLPDGHGMSPGDFRRCRSPSARRSAGNIGRRATLLPSPRRRSFLSVIVSGWWSPFCSGVLLLRASRWGFWCSFLLCWGWLYMILFYTVFNRARN